MGRPLKIAKAQLLTLTSTTDAGDYVTVSENLYNLNVIYNMPFVVATTTGGLTAGTTYWILEILSANTFTVSATPVNANPNYTPVNLSDAGPVTVKLSVGLVDLGFQNPDTSAQSGNTSTNPGQSYGVVGGNTAIYGPQILAQVAIGINGTGTLYSYPANTNPSVFGQGTDFANIATGAAIQVAVANVNGTTDYVNIGFASSTHGNITVAVASTANTGNIVTTTGNAQLLELNFPVTFTANLGGLVTGTTYFVKSVANTTAFTVSSTQGGPEVDLSDATGTPNAVQNRVVLTANCPIQFSNVNFIYANDEAGFIVRQKGKQKYLVQGATTGLQAQCVTANVANTALTPNTMSIIATYANAGTVNVQSVSDYNTELFTANSGPIATGNIIFEDADPAIATFGTAYAANTYPGTNPITGQTSNVSGQPYPIVTINNA